MPSAKVGFASAGSAVAIIISTVGAAPTSVFSDTSVAACPGATATVVAFLLGYFVPEEST